MKGRNLFLLGILVGIVFAVIFLLFNKEENSGEKKAASSEDRSNSTILAKETTVSHSLKIDGKLIPAMKRNVQFTINGKLEKGDLSIQPGTHFKFNQLLYRLDIKDIFLELSDAKKQLLSSMKGLATDIEQQFPSEKNKWQYFTERIDPAKRLPAFPILNSDEERTFFRATPILKEYIKAAQLETDIEKHFYLAPFDGIVLEVYKKPGQKIQSGQKIALIAQEGKLNVQLNCSDSQAKELAGQGSIVFTNNAGETVGKGKYISTQKDKTVANSNNVLFSFKAEKNNKAAIGQLVQVELKINETCFILPAKSLKSNKVKILHEDQILEREVTIIRSSKDSAFVKGLNEDEIVLLNE